MRLPITELIFSTIINYYLRNVIRLNEYKLNEFFKLTDLVDKNNKIFVKYQFNVMPLEIKNSRVATVCFY